jgi:hypothetical protein
VTAANSRRQVMPKSLADPNNAQEIFATNAILRVRDSVVHLTLFAERPSIAEKSDAIGIAHVVTARLVMSAAAFENILESFLSLQRTKILQEHQEHDVPRIN